MKSYKRKNSKIYRYKKNRVYNNFGQSKNVLCFVGVLFLVVLIIVAFSSGTTHNDQLRDSTSIADIGSKEETIMVEDTKSSSVSEIVIAESTPPEIYRVTKVVDGDTLWVDINGVNTKIRLIGVNTPETVSTNTPIQCYGPEASVYTKNMLSGKYVGLESDSSQGNTDKYGRALRYVFVDGQNFNFLLIINGYGFEYTYDMAYKYQSEFVRAENEAKNALRGLWSVCDGQLKSL